MPLRLPIAQGTDAVLDEGRNLTHLTRSLSVLITSHVKATTNLETELNQITDIITRYALIYPKIHFKFKHRIRY